jgi:DNA polymerase alpha/epsilon subunit B
VFVPGPRDPGLSGILPRPPLADMFRAEVAAHLPTAVFASNPCRIRYHGTQIVVFRDDLEARMRKLCLLPPAGGGATHVTVGVVTQSVTGEYRCGGPNAQPPRGWSVSDCGSCILTNPASRLGSSPELIDVPASLREVGRSNPRAQQLAHLLSCDGWSTCVHVTVGPPASM